MGMWLRFTAFLGVFLWLPAAAQDWPETGATPGGLKYSALDQINRENVTDLEVAWTHRTGHLDRHDKKYEKTMAFEDTPTLVDGSLIVCTPFQRIIAIDPASGEERWSFDPGLNVELEMPGYFKCRGVGQWLDEAAPEGAPCRHRILFGTTDFRMFAIDARNGKRCQDFGGNGEVKADPGKELLFGGEVQFGTPPAVIGGLAIIGSLVFDNSRTEGPSGKVRAFDARTGEIRWEFDAIPRDPNDPAASTWGGDSAQVTGHANVWTFMSVDHERDLVFLPTTSPGADFWGGLRPGENRYTDSLVALRASTGEMVWHFQVVHHDLWDYDIPSQPILTDLPHEGKMVPAVIQNTKQGFVMVFNRETGEPLFPITEQPVPQGDAPGEWYSPTQPFPKAGLQVMPLGLQPDDAWGLTFIDRWACRKLIEELRHDGMYTPPSLQGTVVYPAIAGGANWGGGAFDPERNLMFVNTLNIAGMVKLVPTDEPELDVAPFEFDQPIRMPQTGTPFSLDSSFLMSPLGMPCVPPPWGRLTAVDMVEGEIVWQIPLGSIENFMPLPLPWELGTPGGGGPIATAGGLVFIANTMDDKFRAFDAETGEKVWEVKLPGGGQATPLTYEAGGRQFVVIAAGGHSLYGTTMGDFVVAYALPE